MKLESGVRLAGRDLLRIQMATIRTKATPVAAALVLGIGAAVGTGTRDAAAQGQFGRCYIDNMRNTARTMQQAPAYYQQAVQTTRQVGLVSNLAGPGAAPVRTAAGIVGAGIYYVPFGVAYAQDCATRRR